MTVTDGTFVCALCGDWRTGCPLCGEAPLHDRRKEIAREERDRLFAEHELAQQERAIRNASKEPRT